uniref:prepilin-type N-terminal cleavage/methylation domain-containing protein n=1 Tax=Klebsiella pneumoniae TaxID=573 RepID=UPI00132F8387
MPVKPMIAKRGFNLVEMIIVIVVLGVALVGVTTSLYPRSKQSAEQVLSVKAAELGRAVLDEVLGRAFDQHSGPNGGLPECVITETAGRTLCSAPSALGKDTGESNNTEFNDVDDYITSSPI